MSSGDRDLKVHKQEAVVNIPCDFCAYPMRIIVGVSPYDCCSVESYKTLLDHQVTSSSNVTNFGH